MNKKETITAFYQAFKELDADKMIALYADNVEFEDPAFGKLKGESARNMWRMLVKSQQDKNFQIDFKNITEDTAHWEAHYTFSQTGRKVHNIISAKIEIKDGKIIKHSDHFNLHKWAKQALGFKGWLLGGTSFFQKKIQQQTNRLLDKYEAKLNR